MRQSAYARDTEPTRVATVDNGVEDGCGLPAGETVVVQVQLRPRQGSTRRCLAELSALAAAHPAVAFSITGLAKDDRVVRVTVGVELGPREAIARFSPHAQAAYAFVSDVFTVLYDHMPVYATEPSAAERAAAEALLGGTDGPAVRIPAPRVTA